MLLSAAGGVVNSGKHTADSANHAYFFGRGRSTVHLPPICYDGGVDDGQLFGDEHHFGVDACHVPAEGQLLLPWLGICHAHNPVAHPILIHHGAPAQRHYILGCGI